MSEAAQNTDREIWRKFPGQAWCPSIHVTEGGGIGINVGGTVVVLPIEKWHDLANPKQMSQDDNANNLIAAGFVMGSLIKAGCLVEMPQPTTNGCIISTDLLKSKYRLTVERIPGTERPDNQPEQQQLPG